MEKIFILFTNSHGNEKKEVRAGEPLGSGHPPLRHKYRTNVDSSLNVSLPLWWTNKIVNLFKIGYSISRVGQLPDYVWQSAQKRIELRNLYQDPLESTVYVSSNHLGFSSNGKSRESVFNDIFP